MTTTHQPLPGAAVVASVETPHRLTTAGVRRAAHRVPVALLTLDLAAVAAPALALQHTVGAWSTVVSSGVAAAWLALLASCGGYAARPGARHRVHARAVLRATLGLGVTLWTLVAFAPTLFGDLATTARSTVALVALVPLTTIGMRRAAGVEEPPSQVVLAGDPRSIDDLLHDLRRAARSGTTTFDPVAVCLPADAGEPAASCSGLAVWPGLTRVAEAAAAHRADAVIVVPGGHLDHDELRRLRRRLRADGTDLLISTGVRDVSDGAIDFRTHIGTRLLHVRPAAVSGPARLVKDAVDRGAAVLLLLLLSPLLAALLLVIRLDSPGTPLFRQTRVGRDGRPFTMLKLRTMHVSAEERRDDLAGVNECDPDGLLFKIRRDPRITSVGAVLRRYSLDELPQLLNVARGDMSLVGPRPALPAEAHAYSQDLRQRLDVKPGITGLWQVSGRSDLSWEETVRLDLAYVDNWSWTLDVSIIARTLGAVLSHRGAY
ncbi:exopolysaccharide biosynthesis polyprenyl glycosylphosphotransferase [Nocardioides dilutus]